MPSRDLAEQLASIINDPRLQTRFDSLIEIEPNGFYNPASGMGTARDKTVYTQYGTFRPLLPQTLAGLYHGHDLSRRVVDAPADEEFRLPFAVEVEIPGTDQDEENPAEKLVRLEMKRLKARDAFLEGRKLGRAFGGAATIIGAQDGRPASWPLDVSRVTSIDWLRTLDRRYLWPARWYQDGPKNGYPETYYLNDFHPGGGKAFEIHESRLILWPGAPTAKREKDLNWSWDHSVLDACWPTLKMFEALYRGVELLVTEGPRAVYKVKGLLQAIAAGQERLIQDRLEWVELFASAFRATIIDADNGEDFQRQQVTYSGTPEILDRMQLRLAATAQIPMLILFGQAPGGLGITGENDLRWFFDRTASSQLNVDAPRIETLAELILRVNNASYDSVEVKFPSLWTPSAKEQAEERNIVAQADAAYVNAQILTPEEIALSRFTAKGKWSTDWKSVNRETREKMLQDVMSAMAEGSEVPGMQRGQEQQQQQDQTEGQ